MGGYRPPLDKEGQAQRLLTAAIRAQPVDTRLMILGDLNTNLDSPSSRQKDVLAAESAEHRLVCAAKHFLIK